MENIIEILEGMSLKEVRNQLLEITDNYSGNISRSFRETVIAVLDDTSHKYNVILIHTGQRKISVIKTIRTFTKLGLKDAKNLADWPGCNNVVIKNIPQHLASKFVDSLVDSGATAILKQV